MECCKNVQLSIDVGNDCLCSICSSSHSVYHSSIHPAYNLFISVYIAGACRKDAFTCCSQHDNTVLLMKKLSNERTTVLHIWDNFATGCIAFFCANPITLVLSWICAFSYNNLGATFDKSHIGPKYVPSFLSWHFLKFPKKSTW